MAFLHTRKQWPVGQGGFHTATLGNPGHLLHYVFDCGATRAYATQRDNMIDQYISEVRANSGKIDILFLSHVHADHINGVERLLDTTHGLAVDTIIMPLLNVEERLAAYAKALACGAKRSIGSFYRDFVIDPFKALLRFKPRRIIFVKPGRRDPDTPGAPGSNDDGPIRDIDQPLGVVRNRNDLIRWKLVGEGNIQVLNPPDASEPPTLERTAHIVIDDTVGLLYLGAGSHEWLLAPYIDPSVKRSIKTFTDELISRMGITRRKLTSMLGNSAGVLKVLVHHTAELTDAYRKVAADLNVTSLSVYSGPGKKIGKKSGGLTHNAQLGKWHMHVGDPKRQAWLGTGDAALKDKTRRKDFLSHYRIHIDKVCTFMLPHHGSDYNFDAELIDIIKPGIVIAAADHVKGWHHPGTTAMQIVASLGMFVSVVTSDARSRVSETVH
jgi:hypothetical protein